MLTTASITFSATSATASGPRAKPGVESVGSAIAAAAIAVKAGRQQGMRKGGQQAGHGRQISGK